MSLYIGTKLREAVEHKVSRGRSGSQTTWVNDDDDDGGGNNHDDNDHNNRLVYHLN